MLQSFWGSHALLWIMPVCMRGHKIKIQLHARLTHKPQTYRFHLLDACLIPAAKYYQAQ